MSRPGSDLFIVDNSDSDWKVRNYLTEWCELSKSIDIATGYFKIGALLGLGKTYVGHHASRPTHPEPCGEGILSGILINQNYAKKATYGSNLS